MLLSDLAPAAYRRIDVLSSFRDAVAAATILRGRALKILYPGMPRVLYAETFRYYPWMLDKNYENVLGNTPAILGTNSLEKFCGQSSPEIFRHDLADIEIDKPLLERLLARWQTWSTKDQPEWSDVALFRSLNMAYEAMMLPAGIDPTLYDVGRLISLWVSAFEILVHPGGDGKASRAKVIALLNEAPWELEQNQEHIYRISGREDDYGVLGCWLYEQLYKLRNDFIHGNPVTHEIMLVPEKERNIFEFAAPLYRMALTAFLPLTFDTNIEGEDDLVTFTTKVLDRSDALKPQRDAEKALLAAVEET